MGIILTIGGSQNAGAYAQFWTEPRDPHRCMRCGCLGYHSINCPATKEEA